MAKIGVVASRFDIAKEFVDRLVGDISLKELDYFVDSHYENRYEVHFKNGDVYNAIHSSRQLKGSKFDKLYIHLHTNKEDLKENVGTLTSHSIEYFIL